MNTTPDLTPTLSDRLRSQHADLAQGVYYTSAEDPTWDATLDAAAALDAFRPVIEAARLWRANTNPTTAMNLHLALSTLEDQL